MSMMVFFCFQVTSTSRLPATALTQPASARLNGSVGASRFFVDIVR